MRADLGRFWLRLKRFFAFRVVLWAMDKTQSGWGRCANRSWAEFVLGGLELSVRVRDLRQPDGYERTQVLRMFQEVRRAEATQGWTCPDPGAPKRGKLIIDGEAVDVLYFYEEPWLSDGPPLRVERARTVVGVREDGRERVLKSPSPDRGVT